MTETLAETSTRPDWDDLSRDVRALITRRIRRHGTARGFCPPGRPHGPAQETRLRDDSRPGPAVRKRTRLRREAPVSGGQTTRPTAGTPGSVNEPGPGRMITGGLVEKTGCSAGTPGGLAIVTEVGL